MTCKFLKTENFSFHLFSANVPRKCIDAEANAIMSDGSKKQLKYLEIGDQVKTLDRDGKVIDTDFIMMMDVSTEESKIKSIRTFLNHLF